MLTTIELVDLAKKKTGSESDGQLARRLHLHRATVSQWRTGRSGPSDAVALSLADATRLPSEYVLACCAAARSDCPLAAEHWARIARVLARHYELDLFRDTEGMRRGPLPL